MSVVLLVEDDPIISHDLSLILEQNGYSIAKICHRSDRAIDALSKYAIDIAILDIHLGRGGSGMDVAAVIHEHYDMPYIFLTSFSDTDTLSTAQEYSPYGYLVKPFQEATLLTTLAIAKANHSKLNKGLSFDHLPVSLTAQERTICEQLSTGKSYQQIAEDIHVSINTVRYHVKNLYEKLQVNSRSGLLAQLLG